MSVTGTRGKNTYALSLQIQLWMKMKSFVFMASVGISSFFQSMQKLSESQQRMQFLIIRCNDSLYSSCFHTIYDAFSGKHGSQR